MAHGASLAVLLVRAEHDLWAEEARVLRLLDDIRQSRGLRPKRRSTYPISDKQAAHFESTARLWLPAALADYRVALRAYIRALETKEDSHAA